MSFAHLFTPHKIRGLELRNRIFSSSHQTLLARGWCPTGQYSLDGRREMVVMAYGEPRKRVADRHHPQDGRSLLCELLIVEASTIGGKAQVEVAFIRSR